MNRTSAVIAAVALSLFCAACNSSSPSAPEASTNTTVFQSIIAGSGNQTGTLTLTVHSQVSGLRSWLRLPWVAKLNAQTVSASGSVHVAGGSTTSLSGTFDTTTRALSVSGGGFTFTGTATTNTLNGSYTAPGGATGVFAGRSTASGTVRSFCGNTMGGTGDVTGVFSFTVADGSGALTGSFTISADTPPTVGTLVGQVTGATVAITATATGGRFVGETLSINGTIQGGTFTGTDPNGRPISATTTRCE